jgi:hypothetical protein
MSWNSWPQTHSNSCATLGDRFLTLSLISTFLLCRSLLAHLLYFVHIGNGPNDLSLSSGAD